MMNRIPLKTPPVWPPQSAAQPILILDYDTPFNHNGPSRSRDHRHTKLYPRHTAKRLARDLDVHVNTARKILGAKYPKAVERFLKLINNGQLVRNGGRWELRLK